MTTLTTSRLQIVPLREDHVDLLHGPLQDDELYTYIEDEPPASRVRLAARLAVLCSGGPADGRETWLNWVLLTRDDHEPVGTLQATLRPNSSSLIAYMIFTKYWRSGYAKESCSALIDHLVHDHGVRTIRAEIDTRNLASIRLVEALGFRRQRFVRHASHFKGDWSDEYHYVLSA